jgi:hypothetical protein
VGDQQFESRGHFFAAAAEAMRRILVERARARGRRKRGGGRVRLELLDQAGSLAEDSDLLLSLDEILARLRAEDADAADIAELHLFAGLSVEEAGAALGFSRPVAYRNRKCGRAWLREALKKMWFIRGKRVSTFREEESNLLLLCIQHPRRRTRVAGAERSEAPVPRDPGRRQTSAPATPGVAPLCGHNS